MTQPHPDDVKRLVCHTFRQFWADEAELAHLQENLLVADDRYVARSYRLERYMAMWLVDVGILQFYDQHGNMLLTVNLLEQLTPQRMVA